MIVSVHDEGIVCTSAAIDNLFTKTPPAQQIGGTVMLPGTNRSADILRLANLLQVSSAFGRAMASGTGAVLDLNISPEALTPRQTLSQMRAAAIAAKDAK